MKTNILINALMNSRRIFSIFTVITILSTLASPALGASVFFGPSHYLSAADIPNGFYMGGAPDGLEYFEDLSLDFGITASGGYILEPGPITDSVDGDDGNIDGLGTDGHSWFFGSGSLGVTFTFSGPLPTAAGIVWTDGGGTTTFEAFGLGMVSLGTLGPVLIADDFTTGTTADDHFFGIQNSDGIFAVKLSNTRGGIEVDHVQFGALVPLPATIWFLASGLGFMTLVGIRGIKKRH